MLDARTFSETVRFEADICILGGGVAGITLACELAGSGIKVVLLESGGDNYDPEIQSLYESEKSPKVYPATNHSRLRMLGGSSNHWQNNTMPFDPIDFEFRSWVKESGWPISYTDVANYYPRAGGYCGVGTDNHELEYWKAELGFPDATSGNDVITTGLSKISNPPTRFYAKYGDRLKSAANVQLIKYATVTSMDFDPQTEQVNQVTFQANENTKHFIKAKQFVMCFGGIENSRMLLHFNSLHNDRLGNQYGNVGKYFMDHPIVESVFVSPFKSFDFRLYDLVDLQQRKMYTKGIFKLTEAAQKKYQLNNLRIPLNETTHYYSSDGISSFHILRQAAAQNELPENFGSHILNFIQDIDMVAEGVARKSFDTELFDYADEFAGYSARTMIEQSPDRQNNISLGDSRDRLGIPKLIMNYEIKDSDKENLWQVLDLFAAQVGSLGIGRAKVYKERAERLWEDQISFGFHHMGGTRMATNAKRGVVNAQNKVFGTKNLYVAGSSVFCTGSHVPPTLTITALSIRLAEILQREV